MPALLLAEINMCSPSEDDTLILGSKLTRKEIIRIDITEYSGKRKYVPQTGASHAGD